MSRLLTSLVATALCCLVTVAALDFCPTQLVVAATKVIYPLYISTFIEANTIFDIEGDVHVTINNAPVTYVTSTSATSTVYRTTTDVNVGATNAGGTDPTTTDGADAPILLGLALQEGVVGTRRVVRRQSSLEGYLGSSGNLQDLCSNGTVFTLQNGHLSEGSREVVSTNIGVQYAPFAGTDIAGSILGTFSLAEDILAWNSSDFDGGAARFCIVRNVVTAVFHGALPAGCQPVSIIAITATSCPPFSKPIDHASTLANLSSPIPFVMNVSSLPASLPASSVSSTTYVDPVIRASSIINSDALQSFCSTFLGYATILEYEAVTDVAAFTDVVTLRNGTWTVTISTTDVFVSSVPSTTVTSSVIAESEETTSVTTTTTTTTTTNSLLVQKRETSIAEKNQVRQERQDVNSTGNTTGSGGPLAGFAPNIVSSACSLNVPSPMVYPTTTKTSKVLSTTTLTSEADPVSTTSTTLTQQLTSFLFAGAQLTTTTPSTTIISHTTVVSTETATVTTISTPVTSIDCTTVTPSETMDYYSLAYSMIYKGSGYVERQDGDANDNVNYPPQTTILPGGARLQACDAATECASYTYGLISGPNAYLNFDVHFVNGPETWECIAYWDPDLNYAADYNVANSSIEIGLGYNIVGYYQDSPS